MTADPDHAKVVAGSYSEGAKAFDTHWAPVLLTAGRALVEGLPVGKAREVLEVATGVGRLLPVLAAKAPKAVVTGMDLSEGMIRLAPSSYPRAVADVTALPTPGGSFDAVVMAFALFHILTPITALEELLRVLRPGGWVALSTWQFWDDCPANLVWTEEMDRLGVLQDSWPASHDLMDTPGKLTSLLGEAGFTGIITDIMELVDEMDVDEFLTRRTRLGRTSRHFRSLPDEQREGFLGRVRTRLDLLDRDGLTSREIAILAWAQKPF